MEITDVFREFGLPVLYGLAILFGGVWGVEYMPGKWKTTSKFLLFSGIVAVVFVLLEIFVQKTFVLTDATKYLVTYPIVAVAYQNWIKKLFIKWGLVKEDELPK